MKRLILTIAIVSNIPLAVNGQVDMHLSQKVDTCCTKPSMPLKSHSSNTLIIFYDKEIGNKPLMQAVKNQGATIIYKYANLNGIAIKLPEGKNVDDAKAHFEKVKGVIQVNYDRIMRTM